MFSQLAASPKIPTVSELTGDIKLFLESEFSDIKVEGEVSQPVKSANGHLYFTLKDRNAQLSCVMWRSQVQRIGADLLHGQQIIAAGDLQVYPPHGKYQMIVSSVMQAGKGTLQLAFEELKQRLEQEGLFKAEHKKQLPLIPESIGVVTSETGAAFQDIISTLNQRYPLVTVLLYHASVQGINAAGEIVKGIHHFSLTEPVDLLIVTRGGGSLEDLWPFNEVSVAHAIFDCNIPVISAVGHETDFSISDFVADVRAATPTQAVVLAVPDYNELKVYVDDAGILIRRKLDEKIRTYKDLVQRLIRSHGLQILERKLAFARERVNSYQSMMRNHLISKTVNYKEKSRNNQTILDRSVTSRIQNWKYKLSELTTRLATLNPDEPLRRGYTRIMQEEKWIRSRSHLSENSNFDIVWSDGKMKASKRPER